MRIQAAFFVLAISASACLSEGRRQAADVARDGAGDAADGGGCATIDCDDRDPCTVDWCDPESGQCRHDPASGVAPMECTLDNECDDGDPCSVDTCLVVSDCGVTSATCQHELAPGCADGGCTSEGLVSVEEARSMTSGGPLKVGGLIGLSAAHGTCSGAPSCQCNGPAALLGSGSASLWIQSAAGSEDDYMCSSTGCQASILECGPALAGVRYRVSGTGRAAWEFATDPASGGDGGAVPAAMVDGITADDFCLETSGNSLVGAYAGTLGRFDATIHFDAKISADQFGNLHLDARNPTCDGCPGNFEGYSLRVVEIEVLDNGITIEIQAGLVGALEPFKAVLYSHRNSLTGRFEPLTIVPNGIAVQTGGTLELVRRPQDAVTPL